MGGCVIARTNTLAGIRPDSLVQANRQLVEGGRLLLAATGPLGVRPACAHSPKMSRNQLTHTGVTLV